jgi:DHA1 family tetracycline resistance protein-like MFS transporter
MMGAAFGVGFVIGPALGGLLGRVRAAGAVLRGGGGVAGEFRLWLVRAARDPAARKPPPVRMARANPFGAFAVFRTYPGVLPLCAVLALFFFASSVYPAIWPFWGMARFGWSEGMVGFSLAIFGLVMAGFQGGLTGRFVAAFGEHRTALIGLVCACLACLGYGIVGSVALVFALMVVHGPEGFVHPMLTAMMSKVVPENAQGELQGGLSAIMNLAMLAGTVVFSWIFGHFMADGRDWTSPNVAYWGAAGCLVLTLGLFVLSTRREDH